MYNNSVVDIYKSEEINIAGSVAYKFTSKVLLKSDNSDYIPPRVYIYIPVKVLPYGETGKLVAYLLVLEYEQENEARIWTILNSLKPN